ncbi:zinc ribbon domain-containing protein [Lentilactobacillus sunkii]
MQLEGGHGYCPHCGKPISFGDSFCKHCGTKLKI